MLRENLLTETTSYHSFSGRNCLKENKEAGSHLPSKTLSKKLEKEI
jgi:hypothetical protein